MPRSLGTLAILFVTFLPLFVRAAAPDATDPPHRVTVYELTYAPIAFAPSWWYSGWWRDNGGETDHDAKDDPVKMVRRFAHIARGDTYGMRFWNPEARRNASKAPGSYIVLDRETVTTHIYDCCRAAREEAPGLKITAFGFVDDHPSLDNFEKPVDQAVEAFRPYYEKEMAPNLDCVDSVNCTFYLGVDLSRPRDDVRDATINIKRLETFLRAYRRLLPPGKNLATTIWPRLLFTEGKSNPSGRDIPPQLIPAYIKAACLADDIFIFDLKASDKAFIAELQKYCAPTVQTYGEAAKRR
jgi:hypothetical protein